jgi:hypothetical protein
MSKDKLTGHPDDVMVVPGIKTVRTRPTVDRSEVLRDAQVEEGSEPLDVASADSPMSREQALDPRKAFRGRPPRDDNDVLQVCAILRTALNDKGSTWSAFSEPPRSDDHVVATATDKGGAVLRVQVARVDRTTAKTMARGDPVIRQRSVGQRVTDIRAAMDSNARRHKSSQRGELVLALDAIRSPGHVEGAVVDAFLTAHQTYASGLGYSAIWLVGPTGDMSRQVG